MRAGLSRLVRLFDSSPRVRVLTHDTFTTRIERDVTRWIGTDSRWKSAVHAGV